MTEFRNSERFKDNHWFVHDQGASFSGNFAVEVNFFPFQDQVLYELVVYSDGKPAFTTVFPTFFEAVIFAQERIKSCFTIEEVMAVYQQMIDQQKQEKPVQKVYFDKTSKQ